MLVGYARVSTDGQTLDAQQAALKAAGVERIYAEGRKAACLYADLRNPDSIRCYTKIGFMPVCKSLHFRRIL